MLLSDIKRDVAAIEQGQWVDGIPDMGTLRLKVRGADNSDWRRLMSKLTQAVPRSKLVNGRLAPDDVDRITGLCLLNAGVIDWDGLEGPDGAPLAYSKAQADLLLTDPAYADFRNAALWAASMVGKQQAEATAADAKN